MNDRAAALGSEMKGWAPELKIDRAEVIGLDPAAPKLHGSACLCFL